MAKECAVCGKTISLFEKSVKLKYAGAHLCSVCGAEAASLYAQADELPQDAADGYISSVKQEFYEALNRTSYNPYIKSMIRDQLIYTIAARTGRKVSICKYFRAGFDECTEVIRASCSAVSENYIQLNPVLIGDVKQCTFVCEKIYLMRSDSYVSMYVNLINTGGMSVITVVSAGGGNGLSNVDWGTEKAFVSEFWKTMREKNRSFMEKEIEVADPVNVDFDRDIAVTNRIGILGGTFDPIHLGHKALGEAALREGGIDKLIVMPAKVQPFKQGKRVTEDYHRFAMAKLTFAGNDNVEVSDYELNNTTISYTYDTMKYLQGVYPDKKLCFILGTDSFLMLEDWYKGVDLLENFAFIVGDRPGYREAELDAAIAKYRQKYGTETIKITADMPDISATEIREALKADKTIDDLVTDAVERYIKENGLYN